MITTDKKSSSQVRRFIGSWFRGAKHAEGFVNFAWILGYLECAHDSGHISYDTKNKLHSHAYHLEFGYQIENYYPRGAKVT